MDLTFFSPTCFSLFVVNVVWMPRELVLQAFRFMLVRWKKECEKQYGMQEYRKMLFNSQTAYWVLISVEERSAWGSLHTSAAHVWLFLICCLCRFVLINVLRTNTAQIFTHSPMSFCLISACLEMLIHSSILVEISYVLAFDSAFLFLLCLRWIEIKRKCWFFSCTLLWLLFV